MSFHRFQRVFLSAGRRREKQLHLLFSSKSSPSLETSDFSVHPSSSKVGQFQVLRLLVSTDQLASSENVVT